MCLYEHLPQFWDKIKKQKTKTIFNQLTFTLSKKIDNFLNSSLDK